MTDERRGELGFADDRTFRFVDYRHGHSYVVIRGVAEPDDDEDFPEGPPRVIDFFFAGASRISCWKDFGSFEIRLAGAEEKRALEERLGSFRESERIFLLESGTIETHIVALRVYWAEFDIYDGDSSPIAVEDPEYRAAHPPVGGFIEFAD